MTPLRKVNLEVSFCTLPIIMYDLCTTWRKKGGVFVVMVECIKEDPL